MNKLTQPNYVTIYWLVFEKTQNHVAAAKAVNEAMKEYEEKARQLHQAWRQS